MKASIDQLSKISFEGNISGTGTLFIRYNKQRPGEFVIFERSRLGTVYESLFGKQSMSAADWTRRVTNMAKEHVDDQSVMESFKAIKENQSGGDPVKTAAVVRDMISKRIINSPTKVTENLAFATYEPTAFAKDIAQIATDVHESVPNISKKALMPALEKFTIASARQISIAEMNSVYSPPLLDSVFCKLEQNWPEIVQHFGKEFLFRVVNRIIVEKKLNDVQVTPEDDPEALQEALQKECDSTVKESCKLMNAPTEWLRSILGMQSSYQQLIDGMKGIFADPRYLDSPDLTQQQVSEIRTFAGYLLVDSMGKSAKKRPPSSRALELVIERCETKLESLANQKSEAGPTEVQS